MRPATQPVWSTATSEIVGAAPNIFATVTATPASSGNFIGIKDPNLTGLANGINGNNIGTLTTPLIALLTPLQNNGGPTPTEAPLLGSLVIDKGITAALPATDPITGLALTDQRGFPRVTGLAVDVGAVEFQPVTVLPATLPVGVSGTAYGSPTFTGAGGTGFGFTFTESGYAAHRLDLQCGNGQLTGTPTQTGTFPITVTAVDSVAMLGVRPTRSPLIPPAPLPRSPAPPIPPS